MVYHPSSPYYKLTEIINSDKCFCGNSKKAFKPFCFGCIDELKEKKFKTNTLYRSGEGGLEAVLDALQELGLKEPK